MKKPEALVNLLEELQNEAVSSDIVPIKTSKAVIYTDPDATDQEDGITLTGEQCQLVFANADTVDRLVDALNTEDASICLFDLPLSSSVMDAVERKFIAVDEG